MEKTSSVGAKIGYIFASIFLATLMLVDVTDVAEAYFDPKFPIGAEGFGFRYESMTTLVVFSAVQLIISCIGVIGTPILHSRVGLLASSAGMLVCLTVSVALRLFSIWSTM
jgi:hypothetical protein